MSAANVELAKAGVRAFNERDAEWIGRHTDPDFEWEPAVAGGLTGEPFRGWEGLQRFLNELDEVWEEFRVDTEEFRDLGDRVLVLGRVRARGKSGVEFEQSLDSIWEASEGQLVKGRSYLNRDDALRDAAKAGGSEGVG